MEKDFMAWHKIKSTINNLEQRPDFLERDIWFCQIGVNIGDEEDAPRRTFIRPVVIIKKFNSHVCWILPLTRTKKESEFYFRFSFIGEEWSTAILSQLKVIDAKRLQRKIGYIHKSEFPKLKEKLKALLP